MRLPVVSLLLLLLLLLLSAALPPRGWRTTPVTAQAPMPPTRTAIQHFLPWAPDAVASGLTSTGIIPGNCWTGSLSDPGNPDAWRCSGDNNEIYDPCFTKIGRAHV
jgi:hypothetical protein